MYVLYVMQVCTYTGAGIYLLCLEQRGNSRVSTSDTRYIVCIDMVYIHIQICCRCT